MFTTSFRYRLIPQVFNNGYIDNKIVIKIGVGAWVFVSAHSCARERVSDMKVLKQL